MARIRSIKPDAFQSETLSEVSIQAERTFFGLITQADDKGQIKERPAVLNGQLWPLRPEHTVEDMKQDLDDLVRVGLACRYEVDGVKYLHLPTFLKHQVVNRPTPIRIPSCPTCPEVTKDSKKGTKAADDSNEPALISFPSRTGNVG